MGFNFSICAADASTRAGVQIQLYQTNAGSLVRDALSYAVVLMGREAQREDH